MKLLKLSIMCSLLLCIHGESNGRTDRKKRYHEALYSIQDKKQTEITRLANKDDKNSVQTTVPPLLGKLTPRPTPNMILPQPLNVHQKNHVIPPKKQNYSMKPTPKPTNLLIVNKRPPKSQKNQTKYEDKDNLEKHLIKPIIKKVSNNRAFIEDCDPNEETLLPKQEHLDKQCQHKDVSNFKEEAEQQITEKKINVCQSLNDDSTVKLSIKPITNTVVALNDTKSRKNNTIDMKIVNKLKPVNNTGTKLDSTCQEKNKTKNIGMTKPCVNKFESKPSKPIIKTKYVNTNSFEINIDPEVMNSLTNDPNNKIVIKSHNHEEIYQRHNTEPNKETEQTFYAPNNMNQDYKLLRQNSFAPTNDIYKPETTFTKLPLKNPFENEVNIDDSGQTVYINDNANNKAEKQYKDTVWLTWKNTEIYIKPNKDPYSLVKCYNRRTEEPDLTNFDTGVDNFNVDQRELRYDNIFYRQGPNDEWYFPQQWYQNSYSTYPYYLPYNYNN